MGPGITATLPPDTEYPHSRGSHSGDLVRPGGAAATASGQGRARPGPRNFHTTPMLGWLSDFSLVKKKENLQIKAACSQDLFDTIPVEQLLGAGHRGPRESGQVRTPTSWGPPLNRSSTVTSGGESSVCKISYFWGVESQVGVTPPTRVGIRKIVGTLGGWVCRVTGAQVHRPREWTRVQLPWPFLQRLNPDLPGHPSLPLPGVRLGRGETAVRKRIRECSWQHCSR